MLGSPMNPRLKKVLNFQITRWISGGVVYTQNLRYDIEHTNNICINNTQTRGSDRHSIWGDIHWCCATLFCQHIGVGTGGGLPNILPLALINIHTCTADRHDRSVYYVSPPPPPQMYLLPTPTTKIYGHWSLTYMVMNSMLSKKEIPWLHKYIHMQGVFVAWPHSTCKLGNKQDRFTHHPFLFRRGTVTLCSWTFKM